jgi:lysophospholipid acyltransferase (LPLAT)-like uncharacterized protein
VGRRSVRLLHRPRVRAVLAAAIALYLRLVHRTGRWRLIADPEALALIRDGDVALGAFWHARLAMVGAMWRTVLAAAGRDPAIPAHTLISSHGDGALIAEAVARLGFVPVRGSSRRGGTEALLALRRIVAAGGYVAIAADGPKGPRLVAKPGLVHLARASGGPIVPLAFAARGAIRLRSWDRFELPLPFMRGVMLFGAPIRIPPDADRAAQEAFRVDLDARLRGLTDEADRMVGRAPVGPAAAGRR